MTLQPKVGQLFCRVNKGGPPEHVRVELGEEELRVSRHDMVYEDILATKVRGRGGGERERERGRGGGAVNYASTHAHTCTGYRGPQESAAPEVRGRTGHCHTGRLEC